MGLLTAIDRVTSLDELYHRARLRTRDGRLKLFHRGWGNQAALDAIHERWSIAGEAPVPTIRWSEKHVLRNGLRMRAGHMRSSVYADVLPRESRAASLLLLQTHESNGTAVVIAPTSREADFSRRWRLAMELQTSGTTVVMLDNPFMGVRAPRHQRGTVLTHFADFPLTCAASVEECRSVVSWLLHTGMRHVCITGVSQGGFSAVVAAMRSRTSAVSAVAVVPPHSAEPIIKTGIPGRLCAWNTLALQCGGVERALERMMITFDRTRIDRLIVAGRAPRVTLFGGKRDRYVPPDSVGFIQAHLGARATTRWLEGGHVSTILERSVYRKEILRSVAAIEHH